jgi:anti-sigma B factor antagonist
MSLNQPSRDPEFSDAPSEFACVTHAESPGVRRVAVSGELDMATAPQLEDALSDAARDSTAVILDLSGLEFIDSSGLHTILRAHDQLEQANCRLVLIAGGPQVQRVFEITGIEHRLEFVGASDTVHSQ